MLRKRWLALPKLIRFMGMHFADGVVLGWICGLLVIWSDLFNIGTLLENSGNVLLTILFFSQSGLLFGTLNISVSVMNIGERDK